MPRRGRHGGEAPYQTSPARDMLRGWLVTNRISQGTLAEVLGVARQAVNDWVCGWSRPRYLDRIKLEIMTGIHRDKWLTADESSELKQAAVEIERLRKARPVQPLSAREKIAGRF